MADFDAERLEAALTDRHRQPSFDAFSDLGPILERSAYYILSKIDRRGPQSIGELAAAFGLDQSTINRQTKALMASGLIERIADPDGGIARKFVMTEDGEARYRTHRVLRTEGLRTILEGWDSADLDQLTELLERFNRDVEAFRAERDGAAEDPAD